MKQVGWGQKSVNLIEGLSIGRFVLKVYLTTALLLQIVSSASIRGLFIKRCNIFTSFIDFLTSFTDSIIFTVIVIMLVTEFSELIKIRFLY